jgi:hypothetical protein
MSSRFLALLAAAARFVFPVVFCEPALPHDVFRRTPTAGIDARTLAPYLSPEAEIYHPGSTHFTTYTARWSNLKSPTPNLVIVPGTEKDVATIVSFQATMNLLRDDQIHGRARSDSRMVLIFPSLLTMVTTVPSLPWVGWTTALKLTYVS